jgi:hypothetical protein
MHIISKETKSFHGRVGHSWHAKNPSETQTAPFNIPDFIMRLPLRYRSWISVTLTAATLVIPFSEGTTTAGQGPTCQDVNIPVTITANHTQLPANLYLSNPISFVCVCVCVYQEMASASNEGGNCASHVQYNFTKSLECMF